MTIGIAATGPRAGAAIVETLARFEGLAEGAIGGFLSVAAMTGEGRILRAGIQRDGARALLGQGLDPVMATARMAVLMSSGPDRPEPLAQFTPGREGVGLVTGHRFPNALGVDGKPLGERALDLVADGASPQEACEQVMAANPRADAGLILLDRQGQLGLANSPLVAAYPDAGSAEITRETHAVAVLHNAIQPSGALAAFVAEMASHLLEMPAGELLSIKLQSGIPVVPSSPTSAVLIDSDGTVTLRLATHYNGDHLWAAGLGPSVPVEKDGRRVGYTTDDPFLIIHEGILVSANGMETAALPYILTKESCDHSAGHSPTNVL